MSNFRLYFCKAFPCVEWSSCNKSNLFHFFFVLLSFLTLSVFSMSVFVYLLVRDEDPLIFGLPDPYPRLFSLDPDLDPTW